MGLTRRNKIRKVGVGGFFWGGGVGEAMVALVANSGLSLSKPIDTIRL